MGKADHTRRQFPTSSLIGASFGGFWAVAGSMAFAGALRNILLVATVLITAGVLLRLLRTESANPLQNRMFKRAPYIFAVALETMAIIAAVALLPKFGAERYILQAIGMIVGLHFLGLWKASPTRKILWISAGMGFVSMVSMFVPQPATANVKAADALTGFGNAFILWMAASLP